MKAIGILHFGLGPVGKNIALRLQKLDGLRSVAAIDVSSELTGRSLADVLETTNSRLSRIRVGATLAKRLPAKVAIHATRSWLPEIEEQLAALLRAKLHVVSTAEELVYPLPKYRKIVARLDRLAKKNRVSFIGVGVNPGFVLDLLPVVLSRVTINIEHIRATRTVDLRTRRMQLQKKVGVGMKLEAFNHEIQSPHFGHQGMEESLRLVATGLGLALKRVYTSIKPVVAEAPVKTEYFEVARGEVAGLEQEALGYAFGKECIRLEVKMIVGAEPADEIIIQGDPPLHLRIPGGIAGEAATAAAVLNVIRPLMDAAPGFHTLLDLT